MNRVVTYARLQTIAHVPSVGQLGDVFPPPVKRLDDLVMISHGADGLTIDFTWKGVKKSIWVPSSNVVLAELAPEAPAPSTSSKSTKAA